jgi:heme-degrading monooxygenase HmoA
VVVLEVWESRAAQEAWMTASLGPALAKAGVAQPKRMEWLSLLGSISL